MSHKPIIADPLTLYSLGLRNLLDMAVLTYLGRCGILGSTRKQLRDHLKQIHQLPMAYATLVESTNRLQDLKLITVACRHNAPGIPYNYTVTKHGWEILTTPADLAMFPSPSAIPFK